MRLHRFFIAEKIGNQKELNVFDADIIHQWKNVFRLESGDDVLLLDNSGLEYLAEIIVLSKEKAEIKIIESKMVENLPKKEIWLFASLIKKDKYEWVLEKCTELGVSHFVPIVSERSEKKNLNLERAEKIIKEASEQSGRGTLPTLHEILGLEEAVALAEKNNIPLVSLHPAEDSAQFTTADISSLGILIGPEGGWSDREIDFFKSKNIPVVTFGQQILRAETASIALSALLLI